MRLTGLEDLPQAPGDRRYVRGRQEINERAPGHGLHPREDRGVQIAAGDSQIPVQIDRAEDLLLTGGGRVVGYVSTGGVVPLRVGGTGGRCRSVAWHVLPQSAADHVER